MGKAKNLPVKVRNEIIGAWRVGRFGNAGKKTTQVDLAKLFGVSRGAVVNCISREKAFGESSDEPKLESQVDRQRSGRRKVTTAEEDAEIVRKSKADRFLTAPDLTANFTATTGKPVSCSTVKRRLRAAGLYGRVARSVPALTQVHKAKRLAYAQSRLRYDMARWNKTIFSDEVFCSLSKCNSCKRWVRRSSEEAYDDCCMRKTPLNPKLGLMYWGAVFCLPDGTYDKTDLIETGTMNGESYLALLKEELPKIALKRVGDRKQLSKIGIFLQDNATPHKSRFVTNWLNKKMIKCAQPRYVFPPKSPDLNLIESIWNDLLWDLNRAPEITTLNELRTRVQEAWQKIKSPRIAELYAEMPARVRKVVELEGGFPGK